MRQRSKIFLANAFGMPRERIYELGLLLSLGVKTSKILLAFLIKACLSASIGALLGIGIFYICLNAGKEQFFNSHAFETLIQNSKLALFF